MSRSAPLPPRRFDTWDDDDEKPAGLRGFAIGAVIAVALWLMVIVAFARCSR